MPVEIILPLSTIPFDVWVFLIFIGIAVGLGLVGMYLESGFIFGLFWIALGFATITLMHLVFIQISMAMPSDIPQIPIPRIDLPISIKVV